MAAFFHGGLHALLGLKQECSPNPFPGALAIFGVFASVTGYFVVHTIATDFHQLIKLGVAAVTGALCVVLAGPGGSDGISSIFLITQLLASSVPTFFPLENGRRVGLSFVAPCLISLIELVYCCDPSTGGPSLFNKIGGHVWYDLSLHISFILALIDGPTPKKNEE